MNDNKKKPTSLKLSENDKKALRKKYELNGIHSLNAYIVFIAHAKNVTVDY